MDNQKLIEEAWEKRTTLGPANAPQALRTAIEEVIAGLDAGKLRVAEKTGGTWVTHQWIKKAVLLSFRLEDNCFIGARSEIVEGVIVGEGAVVSMGVYIGQSTKIFDRETGEVLYGRVPAGSVVVSGTMPSGDRSCALYCAVIVKKVDAKTRAKTSLNELLRGD